MSNFSTGKYAKALSDRSGQEFPYREMVKEWNGAFVHKSEFEQKHPQLVPRKFSGDAQSLQNARPDRTEPPVARLLNQDSFSTAGQGTNVITVKETAHGRSTNDTVRFRDVLAFDGITKEKLELAVGYSITKVDDDSYTFVVNTDTATSGNKSGGGGLSSAGPVTLTP
jgi:hypothetical protein|tara:strand:- start:234 stop:737 length:504 start_codon:yes stop_codon:yes gene_type:complete